MFKNKSTRFIAVGIAAVFVAAASTSIALAADATAQSNGSDGKVYIADPGTDTVFPAGHTFAFTDNTYGFSNSANVATPYVCPADATNAQTFLAPVGSERTKASWTAWATVGFAGATKNVQQPALSLYKQILGSANSVKGSGGNYSVGVACTANSLASLATAGVWYASIHITAPNGAYTVDQPTEDAAPPVGSSTMQINATTVAAQDGTLSLIVPAASATTTLGTATLVGGLSTSTGALGAFTVHDARVVTHTGWTLTSTLTDFTSGGNTINKRQLGLAPSIVAGTTPAAGVTLGAAQIAGSAIFPTTFAQADNSAGVADTNLGGALTFVAPATAVAGTYTSTMTLTLTSK